jgi:hypothetical protein
MRTFPALTLLAVAVVLTGCGRKDQNGGRDSADTPSPGVQEGGNAEASQGTPGQLKTEEDAQALMRGKLAQAGVVVQWNDDGSALVDKGFPYQRDSSGGYTIKIVKVEKGVFTASEDSTVPTAMMGMVYGVAGGSFIAQCNAEEGTRTLADVVGNVWVFAEAGMSFNVYLPGDKKAAYTLKSRMQNATISFTKEGVLVKGFEFILSSDSSEPEKEVK